MAVEGKILTMIKNAVLILSFSLLTGVSARAELRIGLVPITLQTFVVLLSGALLGSKKGALSQIVYMFGGLSGIPWFSMGGGVAYILSPTFGYVIGFVLAAYTVGWLFEKGWNRNLIKISLAMLVGNLIIYIPGLLWLERFVGFGKVLMIGLYPFIFGDILKLLLAGLVFSIIYKFVSIRIFVKDS